MTKNLHKALARLSKAERAVLCSVIKHKREWEHIHQGMLPFMPLDEVVDWLGIWITGNLNSRALHRRIYFKLYAGPMTGTMLALDDGKVFRRFGKHPERGVSIPSIATQHRHRERRPFERKKDAYDVIVSMAELKRVGHNHWMVNCRLTVHEQVVAWLSDNLK